ncbi:MAG: TetR/AcrR family transcriptional regulator [Actinobacteria bacterium]|nr:TetR/AcrR family transcriptional regulator [Actinomycetota bacterium]
MAQPVAVEGRRARNQAVRRKRVLEAAMALAAAGGYEAVQMRDVAEGADVALGTLYRYFPSKDQLLVAALGEWASTLERRLKQKPPAGATAADRVIDVLRRASRALEREPRVTGAMVTALSSPDPDAAATKNEVYETLRAIISGAIGGAAVDSPDEVVRVLGYVWFAALVSWVGGMAAAGLMADELEVAARLLLR